MPPPASSRSSAALASALLAQRDRFKAFLTARLGSEADAEDVLQAGLVKALRHAGELRDDTKVTAWFYQLLRHALIDHARRRRASTERDHAWATDVAPVPTPADERSLCRCFEPLIATLKPAQAALLRAVELDGQSVAAAAAALGLTPNHASVTLHRARADLRARLERFCGDCARGACLDCDCPPAATPARKR